MLWGLFSIKRKKDHTLALMRYILLFLWVLVMTPSVCYGQENLVQWSLEQLRHIQNRESWVDSVYESLSEEERIAQFFMVAAYSNKDATHEAEIERLVRDYGIGGLIFMQGGPVHQVELTNRYQQAAKVKLMLSMDAEWGLGMRLKDSVMSFPYQLTLGAIQEEKQIYDMGAEIARQLKRLGVHVNFAPVVDVNNNPRNPVINFRSFGEDKMNVALKGLAYAEGLQDHGVMACAKHFPGHGDTDSDSHLTLPVIKQSRERLNELELYPFKILINNGVKSMMAAHLFVPSLDSTINQATSLSRKVTTDLLKKELHFRGLVFSDALNMKGVSQFYPKGEVAVKAFIAGNDILLFAEDVPKGIELMQQALQDGSIDSLEFAQRLRKLLAEKYDLGLDKFDPISTNNLYTDLHTPEAWLLNHELYASAITVPVNKDDYLPIQDVSVSMASLAIGSNEETKFQETLKLYAAVDAYNVAKDASGTTYDNLLQKLAGYETIFVSLHDMSQYNSRGYGITQNSLYLIQQLAAKTRVVVTVFGNPYSLKHFAGNSWIVQAYQENDHTQTVAAEVIMGARGADGTLPITASDKFRFGMGEKLESLGRLQYTIPEAVGINSRYLLRVDSMANAAIADKATPGCQILIAKDGKVIYQKAFGYHTYDSTLAVNNDDLYDLASITKIGATTLSLMQLYDQRKIQLNRKLSDYLPAVDTTEMRTLIVRNVLAHKAGLKSWIPFYINTLPDSVYQACYRTTGDSVYCLPVTEEMFMRSDYADTVYRTIFSTPLNQKKEYVYSDLGFIMFKELIEHVTADSFATYTAANFYKPLGMQHMGFNPLERYPKNRIVPTEDDQAFRKTLLQGTVHDPAAAMLGGVSGHAGLFSSANDLAILMQMLLNKGTYGGKRYLDEKTVELFTKRNDDESRRGLGFDKPETELGKPGPTGDSASPRSFGHSGFTGTCTWADPDEQLIYIFLSNRVHPSADNRKLIKNNIRTEIHEAIYDAIRKSMQIEVASKQN